MEIIRNAIDYLLSLRWIENCVLTSAAVDANVNNTGADSPTFKITDAKVYVPIVTLSTEDNAKLSKLLGEGFKRDIYWNKYKIIDNIEVNIARNNEEKYIRKLLDSSYQGVKWLFVLAYDNTAGDNDHNSQGSINSFRKYFLPRANIENYNIEIDGRNFYDQPINDLIQQYDEVIKISIGQGDDCLLDFAYFEKNYRLTAVDLSKQKVLDADSRAIQQIVFTGKIKSTVVNIRVIVYYIPDQSKEMVLQFAKGTTKVL